MLERLRLKAEIVSHATHTHDLDIFSGLYQLMPQTNDKNKQQPVQGAPDEMKCKCGKVLPPRSQCVKCGDFVIHTPIPPDPTLTKILEEAMDKTLQELDEIVFISSIDSITGKHKALRPKIEDREATIFIKGEFDRKDFIKTIIEPIFNLGKEVGMKDNNKKGAPVPTNPCWSIMFARDSPAKAKSQSARLTDASASKSLPTAKANCHFLASKMA